MNDHKQIPLPVKPEVIEQEEQTECAPVLSPTTPESELLVLMDFAFQAYVWQYGEENAGLLEALRGGLSLLLRPEYRGTWEVVCDG